jgi:3-oxoadipate enol-lactonase
MPTINVNNCDIVYEIAGSGPNLVFIHGETHGIEMFEHQIPVFSKNYRCLAYYRRGHGPSGSPPYGYSLWNQTQDLVRLLEALNFRNAIIVAVAMSTTVGAQYTVLHPDRVRALVLASWYELDGYPRLEERRKKHPINFAELHMMMGRILQEQGREALEAHLEAQYETFFPIFPRDPAVRAKVVRMFARHRLEHYVQSAEFYTSIPYLIGAMNGLTMPILGICGTDDPSPDNPERLAHLPGFRQKWIEGARRFTMMEQPEAFNRILQDFLDELA